MFCKCFGFLGLKEQGVECRGLGIFSRLGFRVIGFKVSGLVSGVLCTWGLEACCMVTPEPKPPVLARLRQSLPCDLPVFSSHSLRKSTVGVGRRAWEIWEVKQRSRSN